MQTLTITKARQNLGGWLKRAAAGEEIGVIVGDKVVAFRAVQIIAADYAQSEYGISAVEMKAASDRIGSSTRNAAAAGDAVEYTPGMFSTKRENPAHKTISRLRPKAKRR
ncbi:MAG: hypothetical protein ABIZ04_18640 [Opitutus sp.]